MKGADFLNDTKGLVILAGVALAAYLGYRLYKAAPSLSPANAKNADGSAQTGYVGAGPLGYVGAATNAASGGWLSTFGDWVGTKIGDATITDPNAEANAALAAANQSTLTSANASLTGNNDAAAALYARPIDYGTPGNSPDGW